jgi:hypothetical protein
VEPLSDLLDGPVNNLLGMRAGLGDLLTIEHGAGHLFGKGQTDECAAESDYHSPDEILLVHRSADINPKSGEDDVHQDLK